MSFRFVVSQLRENGQLRVVATATILEEAEAVVLRCINRDPAVYWVSDTDLGSTRTFGRLEETHLDLTEDRAVVSDEAQE